MSNADPKNIAYRLAPVLDRGDRDAATAMWTLWRAAAARVLDRKGLSTAARDAVLKELSDAVRAELIAIRGTASLGPVPVAERPGHARPPAAVVPFRRAGGGQ
ncbi:hypothetical protein [Neogemmobacter tilapiae]|nr:hypothetical protein [Gemmobacter tilapiae]